MVLAVAAVVTGPPLVLGLVADAEEEGEGRYPPSPSSSRSPRRGGRRWAPRMPLPDWGGEGWCASPKDELWMGAASRRTMDCAGFSRLASRRASGADRSALSSASSQLRFAPLCTAPPRLPFFPPQSALPFRALPSPSLSNLDKCPLRFQSSAAAMQKVLYAFKCTWPHWSGPRSHP